MNKYVRYTCNKKNEPTMREDCKNCPEYNPCGKNGKWCFVGALVAEAESNEACVDVIMPLTENFIFPELRDMSTVTINFGNGQNVDILREDIKKTLNVENNVLNGKDINNEIRKIIASIAEPSKGLLVNTTPAITE